MPRFSRESIKTDYFHVITQGINKSYIFDKPEDIKLYIKIMYELLLEHNLKIIAYCIMNNHTHMLIHIDKIEELSRYMQRLNGKYALYYNKKYNKVGYVFRDIWNIKKNHIELGRIIIVLKDKYKLSNRKIEKLLGIGREKIRNLYNENK